MGDFQGQANTVNSLSCSFLEQVFVARQHSLSKRGGGGAMSLKCAGAAGGAALKGCLCQMTGFKWHLRERHD